MLTGKRLSGHITPRELKELDNLLHSNEELRDIIDALTRYSAVATFESRPYGKQEVRRLWNRIQDKLG